MLEIIRSFVVAIRVAATVLLANWDLTQNSGNSATSDSRQVENTFTGTLEALLYAAK